MSSSSSSPRDTGSFLASSLRRDRLARRFYLTNKAFDLAEKYQVPGLHPFRYLSCRHPVDLSRVRCQQGQDTRIIGSRGDAFRKLTGYKRHALTETGICPLAVPGDAKHLVVTDSDEHDEDGHIIEDAATRIKMVEKRLFKKLPLMQTRDRAAVPLRRP